MALLVPVAHTGHWLWVLYLPPILIVAGSILWTSLRQRRAKLKDASSAGDRTRARGD